jgi:eukaryotic-like serine/threonine-protein kinase
MAELDELTRRANARVGTWLKDKWHIDGLLGVGGMAVVFAGTHRNKKRVAIKMLHAELSFDATIRQRFLREGTAANSVGHRGAVEVFDEDVAADGTAFLVMELLEGETLEARRTRSGGTLPAADVLSLVDQLLDVLAAAHDKGIVHRDLKPENLFYTNDQALKVLDFGIARVREGTGDAGGGGTRAGSVLGTPAFMAPEQARSRWDLVDAQTDLWAVGATMFTLLTGRRVREADTATEELALAITTPVAPIATMARGLAPEVAALVDTALAHDKAQRWPDAQTMRSALRQAYATLSAVHDPATAATLASNQPLLPAITGATTTPERLTTSLAATTTPSSPARRPRIGIILAAAAVALLLGVLVARSTSSPSPAPAAPAARPEPTSTPPVTTGTPPPAPQVTAPASATATGSAALAPTQAAPPRASQSPQAKTPRKLPETAAPDKAVPEKAVPAAKVDPFSRRD